MPDTDRADGTFTTSRNACSLICLLHESCLAAQMPEHPTLLYENGLTLLDPGFRCPHADSKMSADPAASASCTHAWTGALPKPCTAGQAPASTCLYPCPARQQIIKCQVLHLRKGSVCAWLARSHQTPIASLLSAACCLAMLMKIHSTTTADSFSRHKSHLAKPSPPVGW